MKFTVASLVTALTLASGACSSSLLETPHLNVLEARGHGHCRGQSCKIADLSGSSGKPYRAKNPPKDLTTHGECCILHYNPSARKRLTAQNHALKKCHKKRSPLERDLDIQESVEDELEERAGCKPYSLIFAKGTGDTGRIGTTVGPSLASKLKEAAPGKWAIHGVEYNNGEFGNHCVGLPGGAVAAGVFKKVAGRCPHTKIIMSGYSQGAMVARNGVAYSGLAGSSQLKGIVTFGDPFNGARVKGYHGHMAVYCHKADRVCSGRNIVDNAHLTYQRNTGSAAKKIMKWVR